MGYQESWVHIQPQHKFKKLIQAYEKAEQTGYYKVAGAEPRSVIVLKQPFGELPAGTKLLITASDNSSIARFVLEDGRTGTIAFVRDTTDWVTRINGIEESEYFEVRPYAG